MSGIQQDGTRRGAALAVVAAFFWACVPAMSWAADPPKPAENGFQQSAAFFKQHCIKCHGAEKPKGKLTLHEIDGNLAAGKDVEKWMAAARRMILSEMPPESEPRPDAEASARVLAWIEKELAKGGRVLEADRKLLLPGYGNRVDHESLFSGEITAPAASPPRVWRMSPQIYRSFLPKIAGAAEDRKNPKINKIPQAFSTSNGDGIKDYADLYILDEPTIGQLMNNAKQIVEAQTTSASGRQVKEFLPLIDPAKKPADEEIKTAIRRQFHMVIMREPTAKEMERFLKLMTKNVNDCGQVIGAKATLATVLLLPEALYRVELGKGKTDQYGRQMLAPRELAYAIAFALTDDAPDAALLHAADKGKLASNADVRREVQRILNDKKVAKPRIIRFFEEYFDYPEAEDVFKDLEKFLWRPSVLIGDTRHLILYILDQDKDVLKELLTTNKSFINYKMTGNGPEPARDRIRGKARPNLAAMQTHYNDLYSLPHDKEWPSKQPIELPKDQRAGILTQPSWLAAFATNDETHPIHRGKWVRERLFGGAVPDVPITVDAKLPDAPDQTMRKRMEVTKQDYCWTCHQKMNPIGLTFEHYDFIGHFRKAELVVDPKGPKPKPVDTTKGLPVSVLTKRNPDAVKPGFRAAALDATGVMAHSGDPKVDGPVKDVVELMKKCGDSPRVRQVFVRHAFRYWMGRNETLADAPTLLAADKAYVESGGSMKALIASLLSSDSFVYRRVPKPSATAKAGR